MQIIVGAHYSTSCPEIQDIRIIDTKSLGTDKNGVPINKCTGYWGQIILNRFTKPILIEANGSFVYNDRVYFLVKQLTLPIDRYVIKETKLKEQKPKVALNKINLQSSIFVVKG